MSIDHQRVQHAERTKKIVKYINEGLSESDAVLLSGYTHLEYEDMKEKYPGAYDEIPKASLSYKHKLVSTLSAAAADGDVKLSLWLLEKKFGSEFNQKARDVNRDDSSMDYLVAAVRDVQRDGSSTALVGIRKQAKRTLDAADVPHKMSPIDKMFKNIEPEDK